MVMFTGVIPWRGGAESDERPRFLDPQKAFTLKQVADAMPKR